VFEYGHEYPGVWSLEILPVYDAIARVKSGEHWQTDVLAGFAIGTGTATGRTAATIRSSSACCRTASARA